MAECGWVSKQRPFREQGFTLLEMLVALAVFALAALALLRMEGLSLSQTADLDRRFLREVVAQNLAVQAITDPGPPSLGVAEGETENMGRRFQWRREAGTIAGQRLIRVKFIVREAGVPGGAITLELVRRGAE